MTFFDFTIYFTYPPIAGWRWLKTSRHESAKNGRANTPVWSSALDSGIGQRAKSAICLHFSNIVFNKKLRITVKKFNTHNAEREHRSHFSCHARTRVEAISATKSIGRSVARRSDDRSLRVCDTSIQPWASRALWTAPCHCNRYKTAVR